MDRVRVRMLKSVDSLCAGEEVNLPQPLAGRLIQEQKAARIEARPTAGPAENKAVTPQENKSDTERALSAKSRKRK